MEEPIWAEINLAAIRHNIREVRRLAGPRREIMAVVKANGYGHGAVPVARAALEAGATRLAVARLCEALELRRAGIEAPVLIFGYVPPEQLPCALENKITLTVYRPDMAEQLAVAAESLGTRATVHLEVDTGMGRLAAPAARSRKSKQVPQCRPCEVPKRREAAPAEDEGAAEIQKVCLLPGLKVEGIYSHFAAADETDKSYTRWQFDRFLSLLRNLESRGISFPLRHCANSAAIIDFPESHLDLVRPGIMLYGLYPSAEVAKDRVALQPAMTLKARVAHVKKVEPGTKISYGCTYTAPAQTVVATLPIGYADGYPRLLSSRGQVIIRGQRAPVIGRVCMDQCMVDVGNIPGVQRDDPVIVFGQDKNNSLPVEELAGWLGTINYEVVCWVGSRVPRIYTG
ncbi:MAG: alanine racemase [Firmicutes bacterium]|nr:alanine racemase [Bacillota bacterium]